MQRDSRLSDQTDESLMLRFGQGDIKAFEELYCRHETGSWRFIVRNVRVQEAADDLLQDVWFSVARKAASYEPRAKFRTWLFTIAHNRVIDYFRESRVDISLDAQADSDDLNQMPALIDELAADSGFGPLRQLESREQALALLHAIEQIPFEQREAFLLQAEAGMSVAEIASTTGVNFETAKSRLRYARSRLRELLQDFA